MAEESPAKRHLEPIDNASKPAFIAGINFTIVVLLGNSTSLETALRTILGVSGLLFLFSSLGVFFFTVYHTRRWLWLLSSLTFLAGLIASIFATAIVVTVVFG